MFLLRFCFCLFSVVTLAFLVCPFVKLSSSSYHNLVCFCSYFWTIEAFTATVGTSASACGPRLCSTQNRMNRNSSQQEGRVFGQVAPNTGLQLRRAALNPFFCETGRNIHSSVYSLTLGNSCAVENKCLLSIVLRKVFLPPKPSSSGLHIIILRKKKQTKKSTDFNLRCSGCSEKTTVITRINEGKGQTHNTHTDSNHCVVLLCSCSNELINSFLH